jgi:hypothetical protein
MGNACKRSKAYASRDGRLEHDLPLEAQREGQRRVLARGAMRAWYAASIPPFLQCALQAEHLRSGFSPGRTRRCRGALGAIVIRDERRDHANTASPIQSSTPRL